MLDVPITLSHTKFILSLLNMEKWCSVEIMCHGSTLVLASCKANHWSHRKKVNCVQPQSAHLSIDTNQNLHSQSDQQLCQIWWRSHGSGLRYTGVKITLLCVFIVSFPFLSFPFLCYFCHRLQPKRLNRFSWLMAQNAWIGARKCLLYVWTMSDHFLVSPKNYRNKATDTEFPAKWIVEKLLNGSR